MYIIKHDYKQNESRVIKKNLSLSNTHLYISSFINSFVESNFGNMEIRYLDYYPNWMKYGVFIYIKPYKNLYKYTLIEKKREEGYIMNSYHYVKIFTLYAAVDRTFNSARESTYYNHFCYNDIKKDALNELINKKESNISEN